MFHRVGESGAPRRCYRRRIAATGELKIGQLARRLDLNPRTIRFYEQAGVLPEPERSAGGYRLYRAEDEARLRFVKIAQRLGLTLNEIREVLAFRDRDQPPCPYVARLIAQRVAEVDQRMRDLRALKRDLTTLQQRIAAEGVAPAKAEFCHYIETGAAPQHADAP